MKTHELKIWPTWFTAVRTGVKTFEIRKDDRGFEVGDLLLLNEFKPGIGTYTGQQIERRIDFIMRPDYSRNDQVESDGLKEGYCVLGLGIL